MDLTLFVSKAVPEHVFASLRRPLLFTPSSTPAGVPLHCSASTMSRKSGLTVIHAPIQAADEGEERNQNSAPSGPTIYHQYYAPVNHIGQANNAHFGVNNGWIGQTSRSSPAGHWSGVPGWGPSPYLGAPPSALFSSLNPILDASHTRNLSISPPNSKCFAGTRQRVIGIVLSWAYADLHQEVPHILWLYGYAGCGKSAISQAVAEQLAREGRLAASFFFFRSTGDRTAIRDSLCHGPVVIVLDGVDECEDKEEVVALIENLIAFFNEDPLFPLRFVIASRVEDHLHRELHTSNQVQLLDLVGHTSDEDIKAALEVSIAKEMRGRAMPSDASWPDWWDKHRLVEHIGRSYIFMTTIIKLLFAPSTKDGLTPIERLPHILELKPNFDDLYREILGAPLSIVQIAELLDIGTFKVTNVLINLHAIMQVPGDDWSPVTLWHTSLHDFLTSERRGGPFFADPKNHKMIVRGAIRIAASSSLSESHRYARNYGMNHLFQYLQTVDQNLTCYDGLLEGIMPDLVKATFQNNQTALEVACRAKEWKLVSALVNAGANPDTRFQ
ncbi:hypothetical protein FA13DRAFT_1777469, partial [Coprinellus micaceus]